MGKFSEKIGVLTLDAFPFFFGSMSKNSEKNGAYIEKNAVDNTDMLKLCNSPVCLDDLMIF